MPNVTISNLVKSYGTMRATDNVSLDIHSGEFLTLLGPSGCGKTTLLRSIAGLESPDEGRITIGDRVVADPHANIFVQPDKRNLGMVFQSYALWPHLSVYGNVAYPGKMKGKPRKEIKKTVTSLLEVVGLGGKEGRLISELSGGQQQRVALARALAGGSDLVLFDEPLSNLDAGMRIAMRAEIRAVHNDLGTTSVFVTHDQEEALAMSDRVVVMRAGQIAQVGTPQEVYSSPKDRYVAEFLGFENIYKAEWTDVNASGRMQVVVEDGQASIPVPAGEVSHPESDGIAIKASHVRIGPAVRREDGGVMDGRVRNRMYIGDRTVFTVDVGEIVVHVLVLNHLAHGSRLPEAGDSTQVQFPYASIAPLIETTTVPANA